MSCGAATPTSASTTHANHNYDHDLDTGFYQTQFTDIFRVTEKTYEQTATFRPRPKKPYVNLEDLLTKNKKIDRDDEGTTRATSRVDGSEPEDEEDEDMFDFSKHAAASSEEDHESYRKRYNFFFENRRRQNARRKTPK